MGRERYTIKKCLVCGTEISCHKRRDAVHCSVPCRKLAYEWKHGRSGLNTKIGLESVENSKRFIVHKPSTSIYMNLIEEQVKLCQMKGWALEEVQNAN